MLFKKEEKEKQIRKKIKYSKKKKNSLKNGEASGVPLLNFEDTPGVPLLNFEGGGILGSHF